MALPGIVSHTSSTPVGATHASPLRLPTNASAHCHSPRGGTPFVGAHQCVCPVSRLRNALHACATPCTFAHARRGDACVAPTATNARTPLVFPVRPNWNAPTTPSPPFPAPPRSTPAMPRAFVPVSSPLRRGDHRGEVTPRLLSFPRGGAPPSPAPTPPGCPGPSACWDGQGQGTL